MPLETGLEPKTVPKYIREWELYKNFCKREGWQKIPGKDQPFVITVIKQYLQWRSNRNNIRSLTGIKSKIKHCGICHGHILPTSRTDAPSPLRYQVKLITQHIGKCQRRMKKKKGLSTEIKRSLALGRIAVGILLSAYGATSLKGWTRLKKCTRHWLSMCVTMHSGAMRYKLLRKLRKGRSLRWSTIDRTYRMASDWHKMRRKGSFSVSFPSQPQYKALKYDIYSPSGQVQRQVTAATILQWHTSTRKSDGMLFSPTGERTPTRQQFQQWIRESFREILVGDPEEIESMIQAMTPHSWRAGLAGDLDREGVARRVIMKRGRWNDEKVMEQYARDALGQRLTSIRYNRVTDDSSIHKRAMNKAPPPPDISSDSSDGEVDISSTNAVNSKGNKLDTFEKNLRKRTKRTRALSTKSKRTGSKRRRRVPGETQQRTHQPTPGHHTRA